MRKARAVTLLKVSDTELIRHESLAYVDGYADAREYGQDGFFLPTKYTPAGRESYMQGFKKGLRVFRVNNPSGVRRFD